MKHRPRNQTSAQGYTVISLPATGGYVDKEVGICGWGFQLYWSGVVRGLSFKLDDVKNDAVSVEYPESFDGKFDRLFISSSSSTSSTGTIYIVIQLGPGPHGFSFYPGPRLLPLLFIKDWSDQTGAPPSLQCGDIDAWPIVIEFFNNGVGAATVDIYSTVFDTMPPNPHSEYTAQAVPVSGVLQLVVDHPVRRVRVDMAGANIELDIRVYAVRQ